MLLDNRRLFFKVAATGLLSTFFLTGCSMLQPTGIARETLMPVPANVPADWRAEVPAKAGSAHIWWKAIQDPVLDELATSALAQSPSLDIIEAKIAQARATKSQIFAGALPTLNGVGQGTQAQQGAAEVRQTTGLARIDTSWELDLFGAVKHAKSAALARAAAVEVTLEDARLLLSAEVALGYTAYQSCMAALRLNNQDQTSRLKTLELTSASVAAGLTAPYLKVRAQASLSDAVGQGAAVKAQCEQAENNLVRLTGLSLGKLQALLSRQDSNIYLAKLLDVWALGLPGDVLATRPDVRAAKNLLEAAGAEVGLAIADQLPRLSLNGGLTYTRQDSGTAVSFGGWSFGPTLSLPIFDGGRKRAATQAAYARLQEAQAQYNLTLENGVAEIENRLSQYKASITRVAEAETTATLYQSYFDTLTRRYVEGAANLLELEDARRVWLGAQQGLLFARQEHLQTWIYLNKATAGGTGGYAPA